MFKPPTIEEAKEYADSIGYKTFNAAKWWYHYDSKDWHIGKTKMKRWRSSIQTWFIGSPEWLEKQRKKKADIKLETDQRERYTDYIKEASEIKLEEMRKAPEWQFVWWLIDELRPEI